MHFRGESQGFGEQAVYRKSRECFKSLENWDGYLSMSAVEKRKLRRREKQWVFCPMWTFHFIRIFKYFYSKYPEHFLNKTSSPWFFYSLGIGPGWGTSQRKWGSSNSKPTPDSEDNPEISVFALHHWPSGQPQDWLKALLFPTSLFHPHSQLPQAPAPGDTKLTSNHYKGGYHSQHLDSLGSGRGARHNWEDKSSKNVSVKNETGFGSRHLPKATGRRGEQTDVKEPPGSWHRWDNGFFSPEGAKPPLSLGSCITQTTRKFTIDESSVLTLRIFLLGLP